MKKFGIDISDAQGKFNMDNAVNNDKVGFVIIKGGGGNNGLYVNKQFETNYSNAKRLGLNVGCYWFSKALTVADATKEATYFYENCIKGKQFDLPIYIDVEHKDMLAVGKTLLTQIIKTFLSYLQNKGCYVGIYSSNSMFRDYMDDNALQAYEHWVAQWTNNCTYTSTYGMWQFGGETNKIRSNTIAGVVCDQDYMLKDYPTIIKQLGKNGYEKVVKNMTTKAQAVIDYAKNEEGYLEKNTNSQLDDKTANAGYNNYTKYTRDVDNSGICDAKFQGQAWCAGFVLAVPLALYNVETVRKLYYLPITGCKAYNCGYFAGYFQKANAWYTSNPQPGDVIFFQTFNSNGTVKYNYAHVGIVISVTSSTVTTVEGNTSSGSTVIANGGAVCKKTYSLSYKGIKGYGRPCYDVKAATISTTTTTTAANKTISVDATYLKQGMKFTEKVNPIKTLQIILNGYGYNCGTPDGDFGNNTANALANFQKANGLTADKECGKLTWTKCIGK